MNYLKLLTRKGRQEAVREAVREHLSIDRIAGLAADYVSRLLADACDGVSDERMAEVCGRCVDGAALFSAVAEAVSDKRVTREEAVEICRQTSRLTRCIVTQERIDAIVGKIAERIP